MFGKYFKFGSLKSFGSPSAWPEVDWFAVPEAGGQGHTPCTGSFGKRSEYVRWRWPFPGRIRCLRRAGWTKISTSSARLWRIYSGHTHIRKAQVSGRLTRH